MDEKQREWHRLFGLAWTDFFWKRPATVELERDLSLQQQFLDVIIIRREDSTLNVAMPDGMEELAEYNLVSFKSHRDKLTEAALEELVGHGVAFRKLVSPSTDEADLLPRDNFRLFAVCGWYPKQLAAAGVPVKEVKPGVYDVPVFSRAIRVVAANRLPLAVQNAMLHLFSANEQRLEYGKKHYQVRSGVTSTLLLQLFQKYNEEVQAMPTAIELLEEFNRETIEKFLKETPVEKRLEGIPTEKRLQDVSPEEMLAALPPHKREQLRKLLNSELPPAAE